MADPEKNGSMDSTSSDDDLLLEDVDFGDMKGLEDAAQDSERALPRKVELDIDDMLLEEEEFPEEAEEEGAAPAEEPEAEPETAPAEEPEAEPEAAPGGISRFKLILIAAGGLVVLGIAVIAAFVLLSNNSTDGKSVITGPAKVELAPFVINFTGEKEEVIAEFILSVTFPTPEAKAEFESRSVVLRDLVFRYVQGQGAGILDDAEGRKKLLIGLKDIFDQTLKTGPVEQVKILSFRPV